MNEIWDILKIEQTKDKDALKKAYRMRLSSVNPEDDPEGFMALRKAYEEALRLADMEQPEEEDTSELTKQMSEIYEDFSKRIDVDVWQNLFNEDVFVSLDTGEDAFYELLGFLINHAFIPQKVWKLIVTQFDMEHRRSELNEKFPENYIEFIFNNSMFDDIINYELFEGAMFATAEEIDRFIEKFFELDRRVRRQDTEGAKVLYEELSQSELSHPYLEVMKYRMQIQQLTSNTEAEWKPCPEIFEIYNSVRDIVEDVEPDITLLQFCGDTAILCDRLDDAIVYFERAKELDPENYFVRAKQAELAFRKGDYKESRDAYLDLLKENHYDNNVRIGMIRANQELIHIHEQQLQENPDNIEAKLEIAWSRYQSYQFPEAIAILDTFEPTEEKTFEYYNVKGRTYLCLNEFEQALSCFEKWKAAIEALAADDMSEETQKKRVRYEYVCFLIGDCYLRMKQYEKARTYLSRALEKDHDEIILSYEAACELEYESKQYWDCLKACERVIEHDSRDYIGYMFRAKSYFELNYYQEAFTACEHAIHLYPYVSEPYALEIRIFMVANQLDQAKAVIERYENLQIHSDEIHYYKARVLAKEDDYQGAIACLKACIEQSDLANSDMEHVEDLFMMLGFCYEHEEQFEDEIAAFEKVIELNPDHDTVYSCLGIVYRMKGKFKEAFEMFTKQIDKHPSAQAYIERGILNRALENYKSAVSDFENALRYDPKNAYASSRLGLIYEMHREFGKAFDYYMEALTNIPKEQAGERAEVTSFIARVLQCMNRFEESEKIYLDFFEHFSLNADVAYDYSELLLRCKKYDDAIAILRKCIDSLPYDSDVQACIRQLIDAYGQAGYIDFAHETYQLAMEKNPKDYRACAVMGDVFKHLKRYDEARALYEKAIKLDTNNDENYYSDLMECISSKKGFLKPDIKRYVERATIAKEKMYCPVQYIKMARLLRVMKKYQEAVEVIDRGIKIRRCMNCFYSKCHEAVFEKGKIYEAMRDYEMARMFYEEAIRICGSNAYYEEQLKRIQNK